ncbi:hypothetical protein G9A89_004622 [Geosiphon pyriformis]|nr:hypothetical protein G9A89_004622 [Geosiphon pyriformis]
MVVNAVVGLVVEQVDNSGLDIVALINIELVVVDNMIVVIGNNVDYSFVVGLIAIFYNRISSVLEFHNNNNFGFGCWMVVRSCFDCVIVGVGIFVVVVIAAAAVVAVG